MFGAGMDSMYFCIRDDDTNFFTSPDELEAAYGEITKRGPVSLAIIPFCRAGSNKAVPVKFRGCGSIHPLHKNQALVSWLRTSIAEGRFEPMLHGYHHDDEQCRWEFAEGKDLANKLRDGRTYLEDLLGRSIRVFVPPHNAIGKQGLRAVIGEGLHLGCTAGIRSGWSPFSQATWVNWLRFRKWRAGGRPGFPWIIDLGDHSEIAATPVTPLSCIHENEMIFEHALEVGGVFCAATHYWELGSPSMHSGTHSVGEHLGQLIHRAVSDPRVVWRSVGDILSSNTLRN